MTVADLKRRVRKLKHAEKSIRTRGNMRDDIPPVWDKFFCLSTDSKRKNLYTLSELATMSKEEYKGVVDEFFARVYYEAYVYNGNIDASIYDPQLLAQLDLSPIADEAAVKKRFRELAKKYHPDTGGDQVKFVALMKVYRELTESAEI